MKLADFARKKVQSKTGFTYINMLYCHRGEARRGEFMEQELKRKTMVIGHKTPDTDSICSAICYANLKHELTGNEYVPVRAGHINRETHGSSTVTPSF